MMARMVELGKMTQDQLINNHDTRYSVTLLIWGLGGLVVSICELTGRWFDNDKDFNRKWLSFINKTPT